MAAGLRERLKDAAGGLRGRRLAALVIAVAVLVAGGTYAAVALTGPEGTHVTAYFRAGVGVHAGSDVRILGVRVGSIDSVTPQAKRVRVELTLDHGVRAPAGAKAAVVSPSVVSGRFVQLSPAYTGGPALRGGDEIPVSRTATPVEIDQLYQSITDLTDALGPEGANKDGSLSDLIDTGAKNLEGNGKAIGDSIKQFGAATQTLSGSSGDLFATIKNLKSFTGMLKKNDKKVRTAEKQLSDVSTFLSADRKNLAAALKELGTALRKVQAFVKDNRGAIKSDVDDLADITQVLVKRRRSLAEAMDGVPLAADNVVRAYNPSSRALDGRANILELSPGRNVDPQPAQGTDGLVPVPESRLEDLPALPLPTVGEVYGSPGGAAAKGGGR